MALVGRLLVHPRWPIEFVLQQVEKENRNYPLLICYHVATIVKRRLEMGKKIFLFRVVQLNA